MTELTTGQSATLLKREVTNDLKTIISILKMDLDYIHSFNDQNNIPNCRSTEITTPLGSALGFVNQAIEGLEKNGVSVE